MIFFYSYYILKPLSYPDLSTIASILMLTLNHVQQPHPTAAAATSSSRLIRPNPLPAHSRNHASPGLEHACVRQAMECSTANYT